jgi:hypothetical protein
MATHSIWNFSFKKSTVHCSYYFLYDRPVIFLPTTPFSSTNKMEWHNIAETLLRVVCDTKTLHPPCWEGLGYHQGLVKLMEIEVSIKTIFWRPRTSMVFITCNWSVIKVLLSCASKLFANGNWGYHQCLLWIHLKVTFYN